MFLVFSPQSVHFFLPLFSKDQRYSDGYLPGDEEQAAKHFTEHVLVLGQQRHRVHPFQACPGGWHDGEGVAYMHDSIPFQVIV